MFWRRASRAAMLTTFTGASPTALSDTRSTGLARCATREMVATKSFGHAGQKPSKLGTIAAFRS